MMTLKEIEGRWRDADVVSVHVREVF